MKINISLDTILSIGGCATFIIFIYHRVKKNKIISFKKEVTFDKNLQIEYIPIIDNNDTNKHNLFYTLDEIDQFKRERYNSDYDDDYDYEYI